MLKKLLVRGKRTFKRAHNTRNKTAPGTAVPGAVSLFTRFSSRHCQPYHSKDEQQNTDYLRCRKSKEESAIVVAAEEFGAEADDSVAYKVNVYETVFHSASFIKSQQNEEKAENAK